MLMSLHGRDVRRQLKKDIGVWCVRHGAELPKFYVNNSLRAIPRFTYDAGSFVAALVLYREYLRI